MGSTNFTRVGVPGVGYNDIGQSFKGNKTD